MYVCIYRIKLYYRYNISVQRTINIKEYLWVLAADGTVDPVVGNIVSDVVFVSTV